MTELKKVLGALAVVLGLTLFLDVDVITKLVCLAIIGGTAFLYHQDLTSHKVSGENQPQPSSSPSFFVQV